MEFATYKTAAEIAREAAVDIRHVQYAAAVAGVAPAKRIGFIRLFDAAGVAAILQKLANDRRVKHGRYARSMA